MSRSDWEPQEDRSASQIDVRVDSPGREGLTGTTPADAYSPTHDPEQITRPPDGRSMFAAKDLTRVDCPKGWMSSAGYLRYLRVTLAKMRQRQERNR